MTMTPQGFRTRFPVFRHLVYLASCTQGALSDEVRDAIIEDLDLMDTGGVSWERRRERILNARGKIATLMGAQESEIALLPSATVAYYQILSAIDRRREGRVLATNLEFPSIAQALQAAAGDAWQVDLLELPTDRWQPELLFDELRDDTILLSMPLVCYQTGLVLPIRKIVREAHSRGIPVVSDVYQGIGSVEVNANNWGLDYAVGGTLKYLLGSPGLGFAYVRAEHIEKCHPRLTGWQGRLNPDAFLASPVDFPETARRLEIGTPATLAAYAADAGAGLLMSIDSESLYSHVRRLVTQLTERLALAGVPLLSPQSADCIGPMVVVKSAAPQGLANRLREYGFVVAPRGNGVRVSFHYYNTEGDVESIAGAFIKLYERYGKSDSG